MDIEENKTVKSYITSSLSALLGFWVVLEPFRFLFFFQYVFVFFAIFFLLPLKENRKNPGTTTKPPRNREETTTNK